ncbi:hypothetical protein [Alishewanella longhuensis]
MNLALTLPQLGWQAFFQQQLTLSEFEQALIARVTAHHRSGYQLMTQQEQAVPFNRQHRLTRDDYWRLAALGSRPAALSAY